MNRTPVLPLLCGVVIEEKQCRIRYGYDEVIMTTAKVEKGDIDKISTRTSTVARVNTVSREDVELSMGIWCRNKPTFFNMY